MKYSFWILAFALANSALHAQQILLDSPVRAGELILFPELGETHLYYYIADKPRIGQNSDGKPMFSFLRYVKNEATNPESNTAITESQTGGGVVHALFELKVTDDQIKSAERALQRIDAGGKIAGPVVFKSGTVALVSAIAGKDGEFTKKVVGLGSAPILENQKAAVAVLLNPLGAKILWESFNTPTPDFSIQFEMVIDGFLAPKKLTIEADFDQMYHNETFEAAMVTPVLQAEIGLAVDEMIKNGAIKVTQVGEDASLDKVRDAVCTQLTSLMFDKTGGSGIPSAAQLAGSDGKPGLLDRASSMLQNAKKDYATDQQVTKENKPVDTPKEPAGKVEKTEPAKGKPTAAPESQSESKPAAADKMEKKDADSKPAPASGKEADKKTADKPVDGKTDKKEGADKKAEVKPEEKPSAPSFALAVSYQLKKTRQQGKFALNFNKFTETTSPMPFAFNPGNVKKQCPECFREVNLDDPLMQQRDINATLGGINAADFSQYVNFVNVVLRKKHQSGEETVGEIKIDKTQFGQSGNFFKLQYGYKGDRDRLGWLSYDYKTAWSFFGGYSVESDWQTSDFGSIALEPPFVRKTVYIEADPDFVAANNIRSVEVSIYSQLGEKTDVKQIMLKTNNKEMSRTVEILLPRNSESYEYELTWFIRGQEPRKESRKKTQYGRIDIDHF